MDDHETILSLETTPLRIESRRRGRGFQGDRLIFGEGAQAGTGSIAGSLSLVALLLFLLAGLLLPARGTAQEIVFANGFESGDFRAWSPDLDGPTILSPQPLDGLWLDTDQVEITATILDIGVVASGVDPATLSLEVDGVDQTSEAQFMDDVLSWTGTGLADGSHSVRIVVADQLGNERVSAWTFHIDGQAPNLALVGAPTVTLRAGDRPSVLVMATDGGSGLRASPVQVDWGGESLRCGLNDGADRFVCRGPVQAANSVVPLTFSTVDLAGNSQTLGPVNFTFQVDDAPPMITIAQPTSGDWVSGTFDIAGQVGDDIGVATVTVGALTADRTGADWTATLDLPDGNHTLLATAVDLFDRSRSVAIEINVDSIPPVLDVRSPTTPSLINGDTVEVMGVAEDLHSLVSLEINGSSVTLDEFGEFRAEVPLADGLSTVSVVATDQAGNTTVRDLELTRWDLPEVAITSPMDLSSVAVALTDVEGVVSAGSTVEVNGIAATVNGTSFLAANVPLSEGGTLVTAVATDADGHQSTDTINVVRDLTPPRLTIYRPIDGATVYGPEVVVAGLINDLVPGTVNAEEVTVSVDGVPAQVVNRSFALPVTLTPGVHELLIEAVDAGGNGSRQTVEVTYEVPTVAHLQLISGDGQGAAMGDELARPLVARAVDELGDPVSGLTIIFSVEQGNGELSGSSATAVRRLAETTDANGEASVDFRLGTRAGTRNHVVSAQAGGYGLPIYFSADALAGPPAAVLADSGVEQTGIAGFPLPRPLVAIVTDGGHNRLPNVPVIFRVNQGDGSFPANDLQEIVVPTDSNGRAIVEARLDPVPGVAKTVITAEVDGVSSGRVTFVGTGLVAGDPTATAVTGVVLDNSGVGIEGVTVSIDHGPLSATTDALGFFRLDGVPVGTVHLFVDGSTASRPGTWPDLEYVVTTVPGNTVDVGMPIHLLPLDLASGVFVDETTGATLELPEIPGFGLEIEPGSVTFPDGSRSGTVSVTAVHYDRIPMTPGFGQQPRLIVTIQPAGAHFDPPARMLLPNVENLDPGSVTEMFSFDHDLGQFVSIGPASVSADGLQIIADPGVGVVKAGWHCGGDPAPGGTPHSCPGCKICNGSACVPGCAVRGEAFSCGDCEDTRCQKRTCRGGSCKSTPRKVRSIDITIDERPASGDIVLPTGKNVSFSAQIDHDCEELAVRWSFQPAVPGADLTSESFSATLESKGPYRGLLVAQCKLCPGSSKSQSFELTAFKIEGIESNGPTLLDVPKGSAGEDVFPFAAMRVDDGQATLKAKVAPSIEPSRLEGLISWSGGGSATPGNPTEYRVDLGTSAKLEPTVDAPGTDGRHEKTGWVYVVAAEPDAFSPENGQRGNSFPNFDCAFSTYCGYQTASLALGKYTEAGGYIETGVIPAYVSENRIGVGARAEVRFKVEPEEMIDDVASGAVGQPPIEFFVQQDERSCLLRKNNSGAWQYLETISSPDWQGDGCCDNKDDSDPWDGEGYLHSTDPPALSSQAGANDAGFVVKLNLRTWINCNFGSGSERCGDYLFWRTELWAERDLETGAAIIPPEANLVAEGTNIWGPLPEPGLCQP